MGEYTEPLTTGGNLIVTEKDWGIRYYFPGPDLRYNGTFKYISSKNIDTYISAWKNNFATYLKLKSELQIEGTYEKIGEAGMKISIGGYQDGVCIDSWHMNIRTQKKIDNIVKDYEQAKVKAASIQKLLRSL